MVEHVSLVILATLTTPALASHHLQEGTAVSLIVVQNVKEIFVTSLDI